MTDKLDSFTLDSSGRKLEGFFKIETIKDGKVIDVYESKNLIMNGARTTLASIASGIYSSPINKFVIGTEGHVSGNLLLPKDYDTGFVPSLTKLFSETSNSYYYTIYFTPPTVSGEYATVSEDSSTANSTIKVSVADGVLQYEILIDSEAANNTGVVGLTEAALYSGDTIFSMRCFSVRTKDISTQLKITWKLIF